MKYNALVIIVFCLFAFNLSAVPLKEFFDLDYAGTNNPKQKLDLVIPDVKQSQALPLIVFVHGGGWKSGDKRNALKQLMSFAMSGKYAVASLGYRLSGEAKWPNQIHDCKAGIRWLKAHASQYNIDPDKIGVWGSSAGGHLVAMLGTSAGVKEMDGTIGQYLTYSTKVNCVVDFYGPTNFLKMDETAIPEAKMKHDAPRSAESLLIGGAIQENQDKVATANPINYVTTDDGPFLIVHGTKDPVVSFNQSELLVEALTLKKLDPIFVRVENAGHGQGFGPDVKKIAARFFNHHLRGIESTWEVSYSLPASKMRPRRRP